MNKKELTDEQLIELFACKSVKAALPQTKSKENKGAGLAWKGIWKRISKFFKE
jgi:hypothetical protein